MTSVRAGTMISHRDQLPSSSRYELLVKIASGGMATVYVGRVSSAVGFSRLVAIKRAHAHLLEEASFGKMLIAEAKLASRIHHPNVVAVQNVEEVEGEILLVMDYVEGASLAELVAVGHEGSDAPPISAQVVARVILDACAGLNAAHELTDDDGRPLGIVHRDVTPHNILVGVDGVARLTDFGIAKSSGQTQSGARTSTGGLKGKVSYMAPEYVESGRLDARSDVFSLGVVAWEAFTRQRLFRGETEIESLKLVLACDVPRASTMAPWLGTSLDQVLARALTRDPNGRYSTASELAEALEVVARADDLLAKHADVAAFVKSAAGPALVDRRHLIQRRDATEDPIPREATPEVAAREAATASLAPRVTTRSPSHDETSSLPVAAHLAEEASSPRARRRGLIALGLVVTAGIAVGLGLRATRSADANRVDEPVAQPATSEAPVTSAAEPATTLADLPSSVAASPPPAELSASTSSVAVTRPSRRAPIVATRTLPPPPARSANTAPTGEPTTTQAPPSKTIDKAPPNPYAN